MTRTTMPYGTPPSIYVIRNFVGQVIDPGIIALYPDQVQDCRRNGYALEILSSNAERN